MTPSQSTKRNTIKNIVAAGLACLAMTGTALAQPTRILPPDPVANPTVSAVLHSDPSKAVTTGAYETHLIVRNQCHHDVFIYVDGVEVGEVADGTEQHFQILAGDHDLEAKEERTRSRARSHISVVDHERFTWTVFDRGIAQ